MARDLTLLIASRYDRVQNPFSLFAVFAQPTFRALTHVYRYPRVRKIIDPTSCTPCAPL